MVRHSPSVGHSAANLVDAARIHAEQNPSATAIQFAPDGATITIRLTREEMHRRAAGVATALQSRGIAPGDRVLLLCGTSADFAVGLYGCFYAGACAVPCPPPRSAAHRRRYASIAADAGVSATLTTRELLPLVIGHPGETPDANGRGPTTPIITLDDLPQDLADSWRPRQTTSTDLAFLQYTSGSTSTPRGVRISHGNLAANLTMIGTWIADPDGPLSTVSWLPVFHDMGLIGCLLYPLFQGGSATLMPPEAFLQDPAVWLRQINASPELVVGAAAPNFALELCTQRVTPEQFAELNLDRWRTLFCGAEPISGATLTRFLRCVEPTGFRPRSLRAAYGLAEATLLVTSESGAHRVLRADGSQLDYGRITPAESNTGRITELVSCGLPCEGSDVAIVDPTHLTPCEPGQIGEVWVAGPHVADGYWEAPSPDAVHTSEAFHAVLPGRDEHWLRTGDLGALVDGELYIAGRAKDLIILRGRNIHPQDVELTASTAEPAVRAGRCAAFSVPGRDGEDQLVIVAAVDARMRSTDHAALTAAAERINRAVISEHEVRPFETALVRTNQIKITTSGKIRRQECRRAYLSGELKTLYVHTGEDSETPGTTTGTITSRDPDRQSLLDLDPASRPGVVEAWLRERVAESARTPAWQVDTTLPLPACGLDSLRIAQLRALITERTGINPTITADSIRALAEAVAEELATPSRLPAPQRRPVTPDLLARAEPFPLTDLQYAYFIGRGANYEYGGVAAHAYLEIDADNLDVARLLQAWRRLTARHDMLRAVVTADGQQRVLDEVAPFEFDVSDLRDDSLSEQERHLAEIRAEYDHEMPSPHEWPPHRIALSLLPGGRARVHVSLALLMADLWSIRVLSEECAILYRDPEAELPKLTLSFRDWVLAEQAEQSEPDSTPLNPVQSARAYWESRLPQLPPAPELPVLAAPPGTPPRFTRRAHRLDGTTWRGLREAARHHGITPSVALLSAYAVVLSTWSRSQRFTVNVTLFNRPITLPQAESIVGDFTSVTPLGLDTISPRTFADLAAQTQERLHQDLEHTAFSGVRVVRELTRLRGTGNLAALPVVFTSGIGIGGEQLPFAWLGQIGYGISQTPQVLLDHQALEDGDGVQLVWDAAADHFPPGLLDDMFAAYIDLAGSLAQPANWSEPPAATLSADQKATRTRVNATEGPLPDGLLGDAVLAAAAQDPTAVAVIAADRELSRAELLGRVRLLTADLLADGVHKGDVVAIAVVKGWRQIVATLALTRIGAIYLPVAADLPPQRQEWLTTHAGAVRILAAAPDPAPPGGIRTLVIPEDCAWQDAPEPIIPDPPTPDDLAYVLYTSGSTGTPKGVAVSHRAALNTCVDLVERTNLGPQDRVLGLSSLSFDLSVFDIFGVLGAGGSLVLPDPELRSDPAHWLDLVRRHQPTVWNSVPALLELLVEYAEADAARGASTAAQLSLRTVLLSGDWIPVSLPDRVRALSPDAAVLALGGATEAAVWSIAYPVGTVDPAWESIPYGTPLRNQWFEVLNERLEPCPTWVAGELHIGGAGLAQGYWHNEEATAGAFIEHPGDGRRLYRTGDLGRYLPDGEIQFLGRRDSQVKVGGHRIELGEIEHVLRSQPQVGDAIVLAYGERNQRRLAAFVTAASGGAPPGPSEAAGPPSTSAMPASTPGTDEAALIDGDLTGVITDPIARLEFKLGRPALRALPGARAVALPETAGNATLSRTSHRHFDPTPVPLSELAKLLAPLADPAEQDNTQSGHGYGSAGGLYPVQVYLDVAPGRVADLEAGSYYYAPDSHRLVALDESPLDLRPGFTAVNAQLATEAAFAIYLVAQRQAIEPLYGPLARDFCLIEAGLIAQLLESAAPAAGLGLCQAGGMRLDAAGRARFALDEGHELLHALVGGTPTAPAPTGRPTPTSLREALTRRLPRYMVPPTLVVLGEFPLTPVGKVDRRALERLARESGAVGEGYVAPVGELERTIVEQIGEVLGRDRVGVTDNFFDLGADSVAVTRIYTRLRTRLDGELPLIALFESSNARDLATRISGSFDASADARRGRSRADARRAARGNRRIDRDWKEEQC